MNTPAPGSAAWHALVQEEIIEPARPIIDPHHHLWRNGLGFDYMTDEFLADTSAGHRILKSVYVEARVFYLEEGPEFLQPTGETNTIAKLAAQLATNPDQVQIAGIVAHADLRLGEQPELLAQLLQALRQSSNGLLRGIRHAGARDPRPEDLLISGRAPPNLYGREDFRAGLHHLAEHNLSYDTWHFHHQNEDFIELARAVPETTIVLDHFGTPLGVGIYAGRREEIYQKWREDIAELALCPNVHLKLGGLAMPDNGFGWDKRAMPPSSDEIVKAHKRYYMHALEKFGPQRCMFESNFPVDRLSVSYHVLYNALKKMVADFSEAEKHALFYGNAERIYKLS